MFKSVAHFEWICAMRGFHIEDENCFDFHYSSNHVVWCNAIIPSRKKKKNELIFFDTENFNLEWKNQK